MLFWQIWLCLRDLFLRLYTIKIFNHNVVGSPILVWLPCFAAVVYFSLTVSFVLPFALFIALFDLFCSLPFFAFCLGGVY